MKPSRGIRNNNPGNIRHDDARWQGEVQGTDPSFKTFGTMGWGARAIFHLLNNYRRLYGLSTIEAMITRWAPPAENDTEAYIARVSKGSGIPASKTLDTTDPDTMIPLVSTMIEVECGQTISLADLSTGWDLFLKFKK